MIAVIAGNKREFDDFTKPWVAFGDKNKFRFVSRIDDVRGVNFSEVVRIGTHDKLSNSSELYSAAISRIK
tara:strand:+ start:83 stop:292 length:210 start_codon:yes stop_codon:yes gene_type:complete